VKIPDGLDHVFISPQVSLASFAEKTCVLQLKMSTRNGVLARGRIIIITLILLPFDVI
jgi:hypothetical protein